MSQTPPSSGSTGQGDDTGSGGTTGSGRGCLVGIGILVLGLILVVALGRAFSNDPREWLQDHYEHVSGDDPASEAVVFESDDPVEETAGAIASGTDPDDQREVTETEGDSEPGHYLRYGNEWLVVVTEDEPGSRIEYFEFDEGYRHYGGAALFFWSSHYQRNSGFFRGGGTGFGK